MKRAYRRGAGEDGVRAGPIPLAMRNSRAAELVGLMVVLAAMLVLPGCLAMDFVPAGKAVSKVPEGVREVRFASTDGVTVHGWLHEPRETETTRGLDPAGGGKTGHAVVFCHGVYDSVNTNMCEYLTAAGFRVLSFDYRGFGSSTAASKTNLGFADDAAAAVAFVRGLPEVDPTRVVVVGHSMGGVYAMAAGSMAERSGEPVLGVVCSSAFSNWRSISNYHIPVLGLLAGGVWGPEPTYWAARLGGTHLLVTHASSDKDVPAWHSLELVKHAIDAGTPTEVFMPAYGGHVSTYLPRAEGEASDWPFDGPGVYASGEHIVRWIGGRLREPVARRPLNPLERELARPAGQDAGSKGERGG